MPAKYVKPLFFLQYWRNISLRLKHKLEKTWELTSIFTWRTCLPSLKSNFDSNVKSHVFYEFSWCGCDSTYVDIKPRDFLSIKKPTHRWDNIFLHDHWTSNYLNTHFSIPSPLNVTIQLSFSDYYLSQEKNLKKFEKIFCEL